MILISNRISRRGLLRTAGAAGLAVGMPMTAFAAAGTPLPAGETRFRSLSIDTRPLAEAGLSNYAVRIAKMAEPILASVFANRMAPGRADAPRLVLRIDSIQLSSDGDLGIAPFSTDEKDWISGAGEVVDAHGKVIRVEPVQTTSDAFRGGAGDILGVENLRTQRLITVLAEWVDRYI
jgi:hypothetical protein